MKNIFRRKKRGFSLTEVLAVLFVVGLLFVISSYPSSEFQKAANNDKLNTVIGLVEDSTSTLLRRVKDLDVYLTDQDLIDDLNRYLTGEAKLDLEHNDTGIVYAVKYSNVVVTLKPDKTEDTFTLKAYKTEKDYANYQEYIVKTISLKGIEEVEREQVDPK